MSWDEFDHDNEPMPHDVWMCPCPVCSGFWPPDPEPEPDAGAWEEPSDEALAESEWVWAE